MMIHPNRVKGYLLLALATALALVCACRTEEGKRQHALSTFRVFLEVNQDAAKRSQPVPIYRSHPFMVNIESEPFLTEAEVAEARVIEAVGGFAIRIRLARRGAWLLEQYTAANQGKHLAIQAQFADPQAPDRHLNRWLAAPFISGRISDGTLLFTPDATREEANQIVLGLNNVAKKTENAPDNQNSKR